MTTLVFAMALHAAPPDRGATGGQGGVSAGQLSAGRPIPVGRIPAGPTVRAASRDALLRELGDAFLTGTIDASDIVTATGGPTVCELDVECNDCNPCTADTCDVGVGCVYDPTGQDCSPCDDGVFCNGIDKCNDSATCLPVSQIKEYLCASGPNEGEACFLDNDPQQVCSQDVGDPGDICQLLFVDPDPCRFFPDLICNEEPTTGGDTGACEAFCDVDGDCNDTIGCNGAETCVKDPSTPGNGGVCVGDTTTPGNPCTVAGDCGGGAPVCGGVCRSADDGVCGRTWGVSTVTCTEGNPETCGPGRCCTPNGNDWDCSRDTKDACEGGGGLWLGVGDIADTGFDDADLGGGVCLPEADSSSPAPGETFLCPKYSAGVISGNLVSIAGRAGAAPCNPYWEIGDDYHLSNCKIDKDTWYRVLTIRWVGGHVRGTGSRMRVTFYDKDGNFIADRITGGAFPGGITRNTVIFDDKPIVPCNGFITIKPAVSFSPDNLVEWAVTDSVQVGSTDSFIYIRKHGFCSGDPAISCSVDADCGADAPCTVTSNVGSVDGVGSKVSPLEQIAIPGGGAALAVEIAGEKVPAPTGACCDLETGECTQRLPWICDQDGDFFQGEGTACNICSNNFFAGCNQASDCYVCDGGSEDGEPCDTPQGETDCTNGGGVCDNGPDVFCLPVPPACQVTACCDKTDGTCEEVTGNQCIGGVDDGNFCVTDADCAVPGFCRFASGSCVGGTNDMNICVGDADCPGGECVAPCPGGSNAQGFGTKCDPNCCIQPTDTGADTCDTAPVVPITVPSLGQPPTTFTWTSNNKAATFGDNDGAGGGTCPSSIFAEDGGFRDRGWWHAFETDTCADIRIDHCCTFEIDGQIHQPSWAQLWLDCDPCTGGVGGSIIGPGSFPDVPIGTKTDPNARGGPFCDFDDLWFTVGPVPAGIYYYAVYSGTGGHFGQYQLHVTVGACQEAACCLPDAVCVGGPQNGAACETNDACAPLKGDKVCVGDSNRPNELCCPDGGACDNDDANPTCVGGSRDGQPCCDGGGECKGNCTADCQVNQETVCDGLGGYWMGFGNIPIDDSPTLTCDFGVCETGSCCTGPGQCIDDAIPNCNEGANCCADGPEFCIDRKACELTGGSFVGGAQCEYPRNPCPACQIQDAGNCHNLDGVNFTAISDLAAKPGGFVHADDVILASPQVNRVCVWGAYFDGISGPPSTHSCAGSVIDKFRVRFYGDDGDGKPDHTNILYDSWVANGGDPDDPVNTGWLTEANGGMAKSDTPDLTSTPVDPLNLQVYTLTFPTATLPTGSRIWLEVANNTDTPPGAPAPVNNTCYWWWAQSQQIFAGSDGTGNEWSYTGTEYRPETGNPSPFPSRAGETGYGELGHDWTDVVFCLGSPSGSANFSEPTVPTGSCCSCDDTCDEAMTLAECTSRTVEHERRWKRGSVCPDSCLPPQGIEGDDCGPVAGGAVAAGFDCSAPEPLEGNCVEIKDGAFLEQSVCAGDSLPDCFPGGNCLGGDFFACYTTSCTGELVMSMCNTTIFYGNMDSYLAVYHDFDSPEVCPCPDSALNFNVAQSDEDCNGEPDGGAGVVSQPIVFPGECWLARLGGWGSSLGGAARGIERLDVGCLASECAPSPTPELQTQFASSVAAAGGPEPKSRYIAVTGGTQFEAQTIRVKWDNMPPWPGGHVALNGQTMFMTQPIQVCENSSQGLAVSPPNCAAAAGQPQRWFWASELTCDPASAWFGDLTTFSNYCTGSGESCTVDGDCAQGTCGTDGVIHLWSSAVAPSRFNANPVAAQYSVQAISDTCSLSNENNYSPALVTATAGWGDVGSTLACPFGPPNGSTDLIPDVTEAINKFSNNPCAPKKTRCDMDHDFQINFPTDVLMILNAFSNGGGGFPEAAPAACPPVGGAKVAGDTRIRR